MKFRSSTNKFVFCLVSLGGFFLHADNSNGLAPEVTDLNAKDISYTLEKKIPYLKKAFISTLPEDKNDGIPVGKLGLDGGNTEDILRFTQEIIDNVIAEKPIKVIALDKLFKGNDQLKTNTVLQMKDAGIEFKTI